MKIDRGWNRGWDRDRWPEPALPLTTAADNWR